MSTRMIAEHFLHDGRPKKSYSTDAEARTAAALQQEMYGSKRRPYHHYICGFCSRFHIGRKRPKGKRS